MEVEIAAWFTAVLAMHDRLSAGEPVTDQPPVDLDEEVEPLELLSCPSLTKFRDDW